jgi:hypothetical protein
MIRGTKRHAIHLNSKSRTRSRAKHPPKNLQRVRSPRGSTEWYSERDLSGGRAGDSIPQIGRRRGDGSEDEAGGAARSGGSGGGECSVLGGFLYRVERLQVGGGSFAGWSS